MPASADALRAQARLVGFGAVAALSAMGLLAVARAASWAITAVAIGVLLALALDPVVRVVQRRSQCSRAVATLLIALVLAAATVAIVVVLGPAALDQASRFADELPGTIEELYSWPLVGEWLREADASGRIDTFFAELPTQLDTDTIVAAADRSLGLVAVGLVVLVTTVAVLLDGEALVERCRRLVPRAHQRRADEIGGIVYRSVARYFAGSLGVAVLNGTVIFVVALVLGVPLAPLIGIWAAITNLIPQIGGFLGGALLVVLALTQGVVTGVIALVVFLAYQQLENNVIQPTVVGRAVDLSPPTTMLAALIGGATAGVPGALVATPLVGAVKSVWRDTHGTPDGEPDGDLTPASTGGPPPS